MVKEHQSTFSPNFPLRGLFYFADLYRKLLGNKQDLYSSRLIQLPYPQFIIFYNGTKEEPERQLLQLHEAFPAWSNRKEAALQCHAVVLNINLGYNSDIMEKCEKLREYANFVACVRQYLSNGMDIRQAIDHAVDKCIQDGILEEILRNNREEVCAMLLTEYDEQAHIESEREIALREGEMIGRAEGRKEGEARFAKLMQLLIDCGRVDDMKRALVDLEYRAQLYQENGLTENRAEELSES